MGIIGRGALLIAYLFMIFIIYLAVSEPITMTFTQIEGLNLSASDSDVDYVGGIVRTAFDICFGLAALIPIAWFAIWAFSREPDWRQYR